MERSIFVYSRINLILAGIVLCVFLYSGIFSFEELNHPIPSSYKWITGNDTVSTGMSRAFSAIVRFEFKRAIAFNVHSIRVFIFFGIQFLLRLLFLVLPRKGNFSINTIIGVDVILSSILFVFCFKPFFLELVNR